MSVCDCPKDSKSLWLQCHKKFITKHRASTKNWNSVTVSIHGPFCKHFFWIMRAPLSYPAERFKAETDLEEWRQNRTTLGSMIKLKKVTWQTITISLLNLMFASVVQVRRISFIHGWQKRTVHNRCSAYLKQKQTKTTECQVREPVRLEHLIYKLD